MYCCLQNQLVIFSGTHKQLTQSLQLANSVSHCHTLTSPSHISQALLVMFSPITPPTFPQYLKSSSAFPATLHPFLVDAGTTNISARPTTPLAGPPEKKKKKKKTAQVHRRVRARFILKLHSIITLPNAKIIQWSSDGQTFTIKHPALFEEKLLPEIFAHNIYASFERQLHFYL